MQRWITDGLIVGLVTVAVGGGVSVLLPRNTGVSLISSGLGAAVGSTILAKRQGRALAQLEEQLQDARALLLATQAEASVTQSDMSDLLKQLDQEQDPVSEAASLNQQPEEATTGTALLNEEVVDAINLQHQSDEIVITWLAAKKVSVEKHRIPDPHIDEIFNKQAIYLGNHLKDESQKPLLAPLLKQIKWAISQNRGVQYHLKNSTQLQTRIATQFCRSLHDDTLLSSYHYSKKIIHAAIQDRGDVRNFFNGEWFERFICYRISELLQNLRLPYSYLMNPIIKFPNGDSFELDLLFLVEGQPLLVECKTGGDFNTHLKKFSDHRKRLSISPERAFLVILDLEDFQTERLSQFWKFKVVNQDKLLSLIQAVVSQNREATSPES